MAKCTSTFHGGFVMYCGVCGKGVKALCQTVAEAIAMSCADYHEPEDDITSSSETLFQELKFDLGLLSEDIPPHSLKPGETAEYVGVDGYRLHAECHAD